MKLAVFVSGRGSNLKAILESIDEGRCRAKVAAVLSDRKDAGALSYAASKGIATSVISPKDFASRAAWDQALLEATQTFAPDLLVLAGFMRVVGPPLLRGYPERVINIHPSLLPAFPGAKGPADALQARVKISGCTVHLVDEGVDTGPILAQAAVAVQQDDTVETLHHRIQKAEHTLLPSVIDAIASGRLTLGKLPRWTLATGQDTKVFYSPAAS